MSADPQWALQQAAHAALSADAALKALIGDPARVYDHVPQDSPFPYVVLGAAEGRPGEARTKTEGGFEATLAVHTWSRYRGLKEAKAIMAAVADALDQRDLALAGHALILIHFVFGATFLDEDGLTRHGVQRFRALTQPVP